MFKKSLSLILALIITLFIAVPATAADDTAALTEAQAIAAAETGIAALVGEEDADVELDKDLADKIIEDADTPEQIARSLAQFIFVEKSQVPALSDAIINDSVYTVTVSVDGKDTVYVAIDTVAHPEIYDARVFLAVCDKLVTKCDEFAIEKGIDVNSENYDPMSYYHIAGELALHMILADMTEIMGATSWNTLLKDIYDRAALVNLNVDETRIPLVITEFVGKFITFIFELLFDR